jgi:hypothetical protein
VKRWTREGRTAAPAPAPEASVAADAPPRVPLEHELHAAWRRRAAARPRIASAVHDEELRAHAIEERVLGGEGTRVAGSRLRETSLPEWLPQDVGRPLAPAERALVRGPAAGVRVHDSEAARAASDALGARAFTHGSHVWLGEGRSDVAVLAHELAHATAPPQADDLVFLRRATGAERATWLAFFSHYLPRKFLNNYMDDTGAGIVLTPTEMADCNPVVDLRRSPAFMAEVASLRAAGGGTGAVTVSGWGGALTNGTLGNFTIHYRGTLTVTAAGEWTFSGDMDFSDYWDFDPKPFTGSGRSLAGEIKVRVAAAGLPGRPFATTSATVPVSQTSTDAAATWSAHAAAAVPDRASDISPDVNEASAEGVGR